MVPRCCCEVRVASQHMQSDYTSQCSKMHRLVPHKTGTVYSTFQGASPLAGPRVGYLECLLTPHCLALLRRCQTPHCDPYPAPHPHPYHWQGPCLVLPVLQASAAAWASGEGDQPQWEQMAVSLPYQRVYHHSNTDLSMLMLGQKGLCSGLHVGF